jgi:hypothetical protein
MISCWGNGGVLGDVQICDGKPGYGNFPDLTAIGYTYDNSDGGLPSVKSNTWHIKVVNNADGVTICCNSTMNSCGIPSGACSDSITW